MTAEAVLLVPTPRRARRLTVESSLPTQVLCSFMSTPRSSPSPSGG